MYTLKEIARRGTLAGAAFGMAVAAVVPAVFPAGSAFADALNPLTERSLTLSSSSPGWAFTDGSGNSTYAPPNSGANGQKTGNYFSFKVSSADTVKTLSFQYCTKSAGQCLIPGNDTTPGVQAGDVAAQHADLNVNYPSAAPVAAGDFSTVIDAATGNVKAVPGYTNNNPKYSGSGDPAEAAKNVAGNFIVMFKNGGVWEMSDESWSASAHNVNDASDTRNTNNYITLTSTTGQALTAGQEVKVLFFANDTNYITNPGEGAFFVKINTYKETFDDTSPVAPDVDLSGLAPASDANIIDGGVTVANVMNQSIQITTKVLETMQFSVGTVDPNTLTKAELQASDLNRDTHTSCDTILTRMTKTGPQNVLQLGAQEAESSLEVGKAYATHSYWRLSSNSSAGATVYYSGHTLSNTSGDEIKPIGTTAASSAPGSEQFGLALATTPLTGAPYNTAAYGVNYAQDRASGKNWENAADNGKTAIDASVVTDLSTPTLNASYHSSRLDPLVPEPAYASGSGRINGTDSDASVGGTDAQFAFDAMSDTVPAAIATQDDQVVDCVTAKMRYIGNIAATTPAGIYTTKINYIAAPQY